MFPMKQSVLILVIVRAPLLIKGEGRVDPLKFGINEGGIEIFFEVEGAQSRWIDFQ